MTKIARTKKSIGDSTILIIVYEHIIRHILTKILTVKGHKVVACSVGYKGIRAFEKGKGKYDLVIMGICLPDIDCLNLAKRIKAVSQKTPVMLIKKVWGKAIDIKELKDAGVDFILKIPFYVDKTLSLVENALAKIHQ